MLQKLIKNNPSTTETGSMAQKGNLPVALSSQIEKNTSWIVDSRASDHMTGNSTLFHNLRTCSENFFVKIVDGSVSEVIGIGTIPTNESLTLNSVLFVPKLTCNLLSVRKLTKDLKCQANFCSTRCDFQDLESGKTIGSAEECIGLYLLKSPSNQERRVQTARSTLFSVFPNFSSNNDAIMLHHFR